LSPVRPPTPLARTISFDISRPARACSRRGTWPCRLQSPSTPPHEAKSRASCLCPTAYHRRRPGEEDSRREGKPSAGQVFAMRSESASYRGRSTSPFRHSARSPRRRRRETRVSRRSPDCADLSTSDAKSATVLRGLASAKKPKDRGGGGDRRLETREQTFPLAVELEDRPPAGTREAQTDRSDPLPLRTTRQPRE